MNPQENSESMVYHFPSLGLLKSRRCNSIDEREIKKCNKNTADTLGRWHKGTDFGYQCFIEYG